MRRAASRSALVAGGPLSLRKPFLALVPFVATIRRPCRGFKATVIDSCFPRIEDCTPSCSLRFLFPVGSLIAEQ